MKPKLFGLCLAVALFALAMVLVLRPAPNLRFSGRETPTLSTPASTSVVKMPDAISPALVTPPATPPKAVSRVTLPVATPPTPGGVGAPAGDADGKAMARDAQVDAVKVRGMVHDFHTLMGENPVGTNAEIMREMMGGNPRQAQLGPPEGMNLNGLGELVDQWNTPYFFHQLSRDLMEIHSAGPDKVFGTKDDIIVR